MSYAVVNLLLTVIDLYWWVVIVSVILSWLVAFDVLNTRSQAAQTVWRAVDSLTEPLLPQYILMVVLALPATLGTKTQNSATWPVASYLSF